MLATAGKARSPACVPQTLNAPSLLPGTNVLVSPQPNALDASPRTQISFLGVPAAQLAAVTVSGTRSGAHAGRLEPYSTGDGASFVPNKPFASGETVTVSARVASASQASSYSFRVAYPDALPTTPQTAIGKVPRRQVQQFASRPDLRPPAVTVSASSTATAPGEIFLTPYLGPGQAGPMMLDAGGRLVWFKALPPHVDASDLKVQSYAGQPVLTWWQGNAITHGFGLGQDMIVDSHYRTIATVRAGNGLQADLHDFQVTPQGTALVTAFKPIRCDLSSVRGPANGALTDSVMQEIDIKTGLVMLEWDPLGHIPLSSSYQPSGGGTVAWPFDFFHINSLNLERDGTFLISARNTWALYDVDQRTGEIAWQLGGKGGNFSMGAGTTTAWQHDARQLGPDTFSVFDNGASPKVEPQSRGIVLAIDPAAKTATLTSQFTHPSPLLSSSQGNFQALGNGDWFAGWGQFPGFSEFSSSGALLFDAHLPATSESYRAFRFVWSGAPQQAPALAVRRGSGDTRRLYASWNGATELASWRVLAGPGRKRLSPAGVSAPRNGFETLLVVRTRQRYVAVQALDAAGNVLATSPARRT
jgi:hypothetical protein